MTLLIDVYVHVYGRGNKYNTFSKIEIPFENRITHLDMVNGNTGKVSNIPTISRHAVTYRVWYRKTSDGNHEQRSTRISQIIKPHHPIVIFYQLSHEALGTCSNPEYPEGNTFNDSYHTVFVQSTL